MSDKHPDNNMQVEKQSRSKNELPSMYKVLMHNDDYTNPFWPNVQTVRMNEWQ